MNESQIAQSIRQWIRSPLLLDRAQSGLLVVDVQEKLLPTIDRHAVIAWNIDRLLGAAKLLGVPFAASEQYPAGLGKTVEPIRAQLNAIAEKRMFSCRECQPIINAWIERGLRQIVVVGIEAHVCVLQTALDMQSIGFDVFVPADAVGSRMQLDYSTALGRLAQAGVIVTTTESIMFEWCETSAASEFKQISALVRQSPPT
jgi:isochorismate hydrolase